MKKRLLATLSALTVALVATFSTSSQAQDRVPVSFSTGATSTTINGTIVGDEYIDYVLNAQAGQTMVVSLSVTGTNGNGGAFFNVVPAGQDFPAIYNGSTDPDRRAEVVLPESRDWAIRVYLMGNDRDTGKTVGYSIDVYIPPASSGSGGSTASGMLPEEDFFVVNLSGGGVLNVRDAPRSSGRKIGEHRNGTVLRNAGGCTMSDGQQWCQVQPSSGGVTGWVAARFLSLPGPGGRTSAAPSDTVTIAGVPANDVLNVRSGPGTGNRIVGALANGDRVRNLGCEMQGSSRWCEIEMMTDMRERGWINARYIGGQGGQATQLPSANGTQRVSFAVGASGTEFSDQAGPNATVTYVLGASSGQNLYFRLASGGGQVLSWRVYNPDGSLLDEGGPAKEYRGQLWQSGDHKVEVTNRSGGRQSYNVIFGID